MADEQDVTEERSAEEIRRDIERTRANMDETVGALGERLNPGNLVDEAWDHVRQSTVSQLRETFREHPVPLALMGLGLGWLMVERSTRKPTSRASGPGTRAPAEGRRGPYGPEAVSHNDPDWPHTGVGGKMKHTVEEVGHKLSEAGDQLKSRSSEKAHEVKDRAADAAHRVADVTRERTQGAREGFRNMMDESPLVIGAVAFGFGMASGMAAPTTPIENRLMGPASQTLKDEAKRLGRDTVESAKRVAHEATEAAKAEAGRVREDEEGMVRAAVDELKGAAKRVVSTATEAAKEAAEEEHLTTQSLGDEARRVATQVREASPRLGSQTRRRGVTKVPEGGA